MLHTLPRNPFTPTVGDSGEIKSDNEQIQSSTEQGKEIDCSKGAERQSNNKRKRKRKNEDSEIATKPTTSSNITASANTIPKLISVVEIIKRQYLEAQQLSLDDGKLNKRKIGLHQYNYLGCLENAHQDEEDKGKGGESDEDMGKRLKSVLEGNKLLVELGFSHLYVFDE